ncbi:MAG: helix-turn-helix domain-containing protein, partial [Pseudoflavonifractor sp.]|nr:helix-turn-helix domain-containing protein [Pseudoflavonifractor sp.]
MSSNIKIERICEWCGSKFTAQTTVTRFCSKRCAEHSYKERMRQKKMAISNQETSRRNQNRYSDKDFLTPTETALFLGVGRTFIYESINKGKIKVTRIGRKTLISKTDIAAMFDYLPPKEATSAPIEKKDKTISEFYTRAEIREKYGVKDSWIYKVVAENNVPKTILRGKAYFSKSHIDRIFSSKKKNENPEITEWYSVE